MNEETISEEQVLHNELNFDVNTEIIHLMKRIVELQRGKYKYGESIAKALDKIDELQQDIFGHDEYINWIYNELDKIKLILKGEHNERTINDTISE